MKIKIGKREPIAVGPDTLVELIENGITVQIKADTVFLAMYRGLGIIRPGSDKLVKRIVKQGGTTITTQSKVGQ